VLKSLIDYSLAHRMTAADLLTASKTELIDFFGEIQGMSLWDYLVWLKSLPVPTSSTKVAMEPQQKSKNSCKVS